MLGLAGGRRGGNGLNMKAWFDVWTMPMYRDFRTSGSFRNKAVEMND